MEKRYDKITYIEKANPYHDARGRFTTAGGGGMGGPMMAPDKGGGGASAGGGFSSKEATDKINDISRSMNNGGKRGERWKEVRDVLQAAPIGTIMTETGNRGAKFQSEKTGDDEWTDTSTGNKQSSKLVSMSWAGLNGSVPYVEFGTKDTAPTKDQVKDSQLDAVNGQLNQMLGLSKRYDTIEEVQKFNPYHDASGRFTTGGGGSAGAPSSGGGAVDQKKWKKNYDKEFNELQRMENKYQEYDAKYDALNNEVKMHRNSNNAEGEAQAKRKLAKLEDEVYEFEQKLHEKRAKVNDMDREAYEIGIIW